jgi:hypothetical protein
MAVSGQHHAPAALYPQGKDLPLPIGQEAGWAPEPVWKQRLEEKSFVSVGDRTPVVQSVVRRYTEWATRLHLGTSFKRIYVKYRRRSLRKIMVVSIQLKYNADYAREGT